MGWAPEGQRTASMSYLRRAAGRAHLMLGEEDLVTFEAEAAAQGFEDINSTATLRLLQKTMRKEETALLGGNASLALGTPTAPTLYGRGDRRDPTLGDLFGHRRRADLRGLAQLEPRRRRRDGEDDHRQRRQYLYAERRLVEQVEPIRRKPSRSARRCSPSRRSSTARSPTPGTSAPPAQRRCRRSPPSTARRSRRRSSPASSRRPRSPPTIRATRRSPSTAC